MNRRNRLDETPPLVKEAIWRLAVVPPSADCLTGNAVLDYIQEHWPYDTEGWAVDKVRRIIRDLKALSGKPGVALLESPFEWQHLDEYGLPWESSQWLLEMWAGATSSRIGRHIISEYGPKPYIGRFTVRDAIWCWRTHLAAPDLAMDDLKTIADCFAARAMQRDLLGVPLDLADLQAFLAYARWQSPEHHARYHEDIDAGIIPAMQTDTPHDSDQSHHLFGLSGVTTLFCTWTGEYLPSEFPPYVQTDNQEGE